MNATLDYLNAIAHLYGDRPSMGGFVLKNGRLFDVDARTFKGRQMTKKECFSNSAKMVMRDPALTYVEGLVTSIVPIPHDWVMRSDGAILHPTLRLKDRVGDPPRDYFGVPFSRPFLFEYLRTTRTYGMLDGMSKMSIDLMTGKIPPEEFLPTLEKAA
jgi:hypothetical protein